MRRKLLLALFLIALLPYSIAEIIPMEVSRDLVASDDGNYDWMNINPFYSIYYGGDPSTGNVVKFLKGTDTMTFLPMALNYNNNLSQLEQISMPQSVSPVVDGADITYEDAYGTDIDLKYETQKDMVKEKLIIQQASALPVPAQYVQDGGGVVLELGFQLANDGKIYLDGVEWDRESEVTTYNNIVVRDTQDNFLYNLTKPIAFDSIGESTTGYFVLKKTAQSLYVRAYFSYYWLNDTARVYPVTLDPSFQVDYSPIPASYLVGGFFRDDPDYAYDSIFDITSEMSDDNTTTYRETFRSGLVEDLFVAVAVKFEELSGNISRDYGFEGEDVILYGTPNLNVVGVNGSGIDFDGTDDYGIIPRYVNLTADQDVIFCLSLLSSGVGSTEVFADNKGGGNDAGFEFTMTPSDTIDLFVRRGSVQTTVSGTINVADSVWHKACGVSLADGSVELWLDGAMDVSSSGITGSMEATEQIYIGATDTLGSHYSQTLDEFCSWRGVNITKSQIIQGYNDSYCGTPDGSHITGNWNITYDNNYTWYLSLNKISNGTSIFFVTPYIDSDNVSQVVSTSAQLSGIGTEYISVDSLMDYMTNTIGLPYTKLRLTVLQSHNISEIYLTQFGEDNSTPSINECSADTTTLGCGETAILECNITDNLFVDEVFYQINDVNYTVTEHIGDLWQYSFSPTGVDVSIIYDWQNTFAIDFANNTNVTDPNIQINYTCFAPCIEDWVEDAVVCLTDDTYLSTYTDQNSCNTTIDLPAQNGTYPYCNYCSENLIVSYGECQQNSTQSVDYLDLNYVTCCAVTGIGSDCSILTYPYNETTSQACLFFNNTMDEIECQNEPNFNIREKEYCLARIPNGFLNETFKCISYVTDESTSEILQTNPEYRERSTSFFDWKQDPDTREYFTPANALVNFYYTNKNLLPESDYILTIECSSQQRTLGSSMLFQMAYEDYQFVFFRTRWLMANASYIIGGLLLLILLLGVLFMVGKNVVLK